MKRNEINVVELPFITTCESVGYTYLHGSQIDRPNSKEFFILDILKESILRLNNNINFYQDLENHQVDEVIQKLKSLPSDLLEANKIAYEMLTKGISILVDTATGKKERKIKIISEDPKNNVYTVVNQFTIQGSKESVKPDILIFINGIPLVLVECKYSGTEKEPLKAGLVQTEAYKKKIPALFNYNQIIISTYKDNAIAGSITGFSLYFNEWKDSYPHVLNTKNPQDILIHGLLHPENLTDIIFNHINFEGNSKNIPRYQQYRAVKKIMEVIKDENKPRIERGGIVYHTQRSGKTNTMMNLIKTIHKNLPDYKIVCLVDRIDLEKQHLDTFKNTLNKPIIEIESAQKLIAELKNDQSNIVFAMIHKFRSDDPFTLLNNSSKIIVIIDEAHRSQYKLLGANLNTALPNAPKIGFTGTPLFKDDRSTKEFGSIIDSYTRREAVQDNCTVPLKYENRIPNVDADLQAIIDDEEFIINPLSKEQKEAGIKKFVTMSNIYNSKSVIKLISQDIIRHYRAVVEPEGFKAMIVTESKKVALDYFNTLKEFYGPNATIVFSGDHNDDESFKKFSNQENNDIDIKNFKSSSGDIKLLIVVDKLLTGFNAPICQTIYFCKKLKEHTLAQAIDRPVTPYNNKKFGLIVDYCGIKDDLEETIKLFDRKEDQENIYQDIKNEIKNIEKLFSEFKEIAKNIDLDDFDNSMTYYDTQEKRDKLFNSYSSLNQAINTLLPSKEAIEYSLISKNYLLFMKELKGIYQREDFSLGDIGEKIKKILNDNINANKMNFSFEAIDILSPEFMKVLKNRKTEKSQTTEAENAIKSYVRKHVKTDPIFFDKMSEKVKNILEVYKDNLTKRLAELLKIREEIENRKNKANKLNIEIEDLPIISLIQKFYEETMNTTTDDDQAVILLKKIKVLVLEKKNQIEGLEKESNINEIKNSVVDILSVDHDEKNIEYSIFYDKAELLALEIIEKFKE